MELKLRQTFKRNPVGVTLNLAPRGAPPPGSWELLSATRGRNHLQIGRLRWRFKSARSVQGQYNEHNLRTNDDKIIIILQ